MNRPAKIALLGCTFVASSALALGAYAVVQRAFPEGGAVYGVSVGGKLPASSLPLGDWLEQRRQQLQDWEVFLDLPEGEQANLRTTLGELGIEVDVAQTLERVRKHRNEGSLGARLFKLKEAYQGKTDIPLAWSVSTNKAKRALGNYADRIYRAPENARLDLKGHARIEDVPGRKLDVAGSLASLRQAPRQDAVVVPLASRPIPAAVTTRMLANIDVSKVLSSFETKFAGTGRGRAINIKRGADYLNGSVIAPGQQLSFNKTVGRRSLSRGFTWAPVIIDGELEPGVGGGTCQVASTLHAAAVYGVLDVVKRRSHSRPSGYAPLGLDATVIDGEVDLILKNPYGSPVIVHAFLPIPGVLRVELLGLDPPGKVEHRHAVFRTKNFYRRVWTKSWLKPGKRIKRQRGIRGYDVQSIVRIRHADGSTQEKRYFSWYKPVPEVFWVAPGTITEELPELPPGAEHVEVDGEKRGQELASETDNPYSDDDTDAVSG